MTVEQPLSAAPSRVSASASIIIEILTVQLVRKVLRHLFFNPAFAITPHRHLHSTPSKSAGEHQILSYEFSRGRAKIPSILEF